jgi:putative flavoprotein involved in K+ transport
MTSAAATTPAAPDAPVAPNPSADHSPRASTNGSAVSGPSAQPDGRRERSPSRSPRTQYLPDRPLVLGAGPAGLASACALHRRGIGPVVLERAEAVCDSWRDRYEGLAINSTRRLSSLPWMQIDKSSGPWVASQDLVNYTERYARRFSPDIRFGHDILSVEREGGGWSVRTTCGDYWSPWVVFALGLNATAHMPQWNGAGEFTGQLIHARDYKQASAYRGNDVLVVGVGASGTDIAVKLVEGGARRVWLSVRTPPLVMRRHLSTAVLSQIIKQGRRPPRVLVDWSSIWIHRLMWGDMSRYGLATPTEGLATGLDVRGHGSTVDRGMMSAIRAGRIKVLQAVDRLDGDDVVLANGARVQPDVVIAATGQRTDLRRLLGDLDVLQEDERPIVHGAATDPRAPGMHFIGYRLPAGQLLDMRFDAPAIARRLARVLR